MPIKALAYVHVSTPFEKYLESYYMTWKSEQHMCTMSVCSVESLNLRWKQIQNISVQEDGQRDLR